MELGISSSVFNDDAPPFVPPVIPAPSEGTTLSEYYRIICGALGCRPQAIIQEQLEPMHFPSVDINNLQLFLQTNFSSPAAPTLRGATDAVKLEKESASENFAQGSREEPCAAAHSANLLSATSSHRRDSEETPRAKGFTGPPFSEAEKDASKQSEASLRSLSHRPKALPKNESVPRPLERRNDRWPLVLLLDCRRTYLGELGCAAVGMLLPYCRFLRGLLLPCVGLTPSVAKWLITQLSAHPQISFLNLSHNRLGTNVGYALLSLLQRRRRIWDVAMEAVWFPPALKVRLERELAVNRSMRTFFEAKEQTERDAADDEVREGSIPTEPPLDGSIGRLFNPEDPSVSYWDMVAAQDAWDGKKTIGRAVQEMEERRIAREKARWEKEAEAPLPTWCSAGLAELSIVLARHATSMGVLRAILKCDVRHRWISIDDVVRGLLLLGIREIVGDNKADKAELRSLILTTEQRASRTVEFFSRLHLYDETRELVNVEALLEGLRVHCHVATSAGENEIPPSRRNAASENTADVPTEENAVHPPKTAVVASFMDNSAFALRVLRILLDGVFDARVPLIEACELLDVDQRGTITAEALIVGIVAALHTTRRVASHFVAYLMHEEMTASERAVLEPTLEPVDASVRHVNYVSFFSNVVLDSDSVGEVQLRGKAEWWIAQSRRSVVALFQPPSETSSHCAAINASS